jgi:hypothetical protein
MKWDDSNPNQIEFQNANAQQTGVVFKAPGTTANAKYKAHFASSSSIPTSYPTQRKIAQIGGILYMVYESAGKLWVSESYNGGQSWNPEAYLADGEAPSISADFDSEGDGIGIVYRRNVNGNYRIFFRRFISSPGEEIQVSEYDIPPYVDTRPVVCLTTVWVPIPHGGQEERPHLLIVWQGNNALRYRAGTWDSEAGQWNWNAEQTVTNSGLHEPSLSNPYIDESEQAHVFLTSENATQIWIGSATGGTPTTAMEQASQSMPQAVSTSAGWDMSGTTAET